MVLSLSLKAWKIFRSILEMLGNLRVIRKSLLKNWESSAVFGLVNSWAVWPLTTIIGVLGYSGLFRGCSGGIMGCSGVFRGCSGVFWECSGDVPGCSGVFRVCSGFYRHPLLLTKNICRPNCKNVVIQIWQEKAARWEFIRHEKTFSDFNIPEALMHYGMILQINSGACGQSPPAELHC